ncbi:MAG: hypothetical protein K6F92_08420 [Lachnospiraceae bacterium]|nr:hypothetical protein [Lachnospiraceae bacterium]
MKKTIIGISLAVVMFFTVVIILIVTNIDRGANVDAYGAFADPAFPVVSFKVLGMSTDDVYGYKSLEDSTASADMLLPLSDDRVIDISITGYDTVPTGVYIILQTGDNNRLIDKTSIDMKHENGVMSGEYCLSALTTDATQYYLTIVVSDRQYGDIYYTVWVASYDEEYWSNKTELRDFAVKFSTATFQKDKEYLSSYISYDETKAGTDLSYVNQYSGNTLVMWGGITPKISDRTITVYEWGKLQMGITFSYKANMEVNGESNEYLVEENFTVRKRGSKIYLLNYERYMREVFAGANQSVGVTSILLGIQDKDDVDCIYTDYGTHVYFVVDGSVWYYNYSDNRLLNIFAFGDERTSGRVDRNMYEVSLLGVKNNVLYFSANGYQAAGRHEGEVGLSVYGFNLNSRKTTECFYARMHGEYQACMDLNGVVSYINDLGLLFINIGENIYTMDLTGTEPVKARENIEISSLCVNADKNLAAWKDKTENKIYILNMMDDTISDITSDYELKLAGFVRDDVVYMERSESENVRLGFTVNELYDSLTIVEKDLNRKAHYEKDGIFITGVTLTSEGVIIHRCEQNGSLYTAIGNDVLSIAGKTETAGVVSIKIATSEIKRNYYYINLGHTVATSKELKVSQALLSASTPATLSEVTDSSREGTYYAYSDGKCVGASDSLIEAIWAVSQTFGRVYIDDRMDKVAWDRDARNSYLTLKLPKMSWTEAGQEEVMAAMSCIDRAVDIFIYSAVDAGVIDKEDAQSEERQSAANVAEELQSALGEHLLVLYDPDIDKSLYYVNEGHPVMVFVGEDYAYLITGYTQNDILVYDPMTRKTSTVAIADAQASYNENGAIMVVYH